MIERIKLPGELDFEEADYQPDPDVIEKFKQVGETHQHASRYRRRYEHRDGTDVHNSYLFEIGKPLKDSLLVVIGPGFTNLYGRLTWSEVLCRCVCGKQVRIRYVNAYQSPPYSCGCKARVKKNAVDHTGSAVTRNGRTLVITGRLDNGDWQYLCSCCGELFTLARGSGGQVRSSPVMVKLAALARLPCPNAKEPVSKARK